MLTSILVSTVGVLGGLVVALYYRSQMFKQQGRADQLAIVLKHEEAEHDRTLERAQKDAAKYVDDKRRKEELIAYYKARAGAALERRLATASHDDLRDDANALYGVQPVPPKDSDGGAVADKDGDDTGTVPPFFTTE